ncbi:MAG: hypothetical protein JWL76_671 [Thermoleophilia bacterium]|nr:hypothetical protein [Thermoleophilia bacterium]
MSEFTREALPIMFMFGCVLLLVPFIAVAMWMAFDGDRLREPEGEAQVGLREVQPAEPTTPRPISAEATSAA